MFEYDMYGNIINQGYDYDGGGADDFPVRLGRSNQFTATKINPLGLQANLPVSTQENIFRSSPQNINNFKPTTSGDTFGARFGANLSSPQAIAGAARGIGGIFQGLLGRKKRKREQQAAQAEYDKMMSRYQSLDTSNLAAGIENQFTNLENTMEDLTVNQQQAQFEAQQGAQQRANIMSGLQGAAGGSGIAGLAQALANQGQLATQKASASIGMQESRNQLAAAQQASRLQLAEASGAERADRLRLQGAETARGLEYQKTATELGMSQQELAAKNRAVAQANAALYGGIGSLVGTVAGAGLGAIKF